MFVGDDQFLEIFLDLQFLSCILTRYLPMRTTYLSTFFLTLFKALFWIYVVLKCCSGHEFLHCNGLPREYHGQYTGHGFPILVELNPNKLVWHVESMGKSEKKKRDWRCFPRADGAAPRNFLREIPRRSPASQRKTPSFPTLLLRFTFYFK